MYAQRRRRDVAVAVFGTAVGLVAAALTMLVAPVAWTCLCVYVAKDWARERFGRWVRRPYNEWLAERFPQVKRGED